MHGTRIPLAKPDSRAITIRLARDPNDLMLVTAIRSAESRVYWSSNGFAFETPGKHAVEVRIVWGYGGVPFGVKASTELWVNYPQTSGDNEAASQLLHPEDKRRLVRQAERVESGGIGEQDRQVAQLYPVDLELAGNPHDPRHGLAVDIGHRAFAGAAQMP